MYNPNIILGVELEVEIEDDPRINTTANVRSHGQYIRYDQGQASNGWVAWHKHGELIKSFDYLVPGSVISVGSDGSLIDGLEFRGIPMTIKENKDWWSKIFSNPLFKYCSPDTAKSAFVHYQNNGYDAAQIDNFLKSKTVGMHVHMSGDPMTPLILGKMMFLINNKENKDLISTVAGRYNVSYATIDNTKTIKDMSAIWHSKECPFYKFNPKIVGNAIALANVPCCEGKKRCLQKNFLRGAMHILTDKGDCELRMFKSTTSKERFFANLEFCVSLVDFCHEASPRGLLSKDYCRWISNVVNKFKYPNIFRLLRDAGMVEGLIPLRSTLQARAESGRVFIPAKAAVR